MSQATTSYTYGNGNESISIGSKPVASGGAVTIPFEVISTYADQSLVAQVEELTRKYNELLKEDERRAKAFMKMGADLYDVKEENEKLIKELAEAKKNEGSPKKEFIPVIDRRNYRNKHNEMPTKEWVTRFWDNMFEFTCQTDDGGKFIVNCAEVLAPIYKVMTESTTIPFNFAGTREDFEYQWNENIVERIEDKDRAKKLTCKHKTLTTALTQPCWKDKAPSCWNRLSLEGSPFTEKYDKGVIVKRQIENFCK